MVKLKAFTATIAEFEKKDGLYVVKRPFDVWLSIKLETMQKTFRVKFKAGWKCDGLSVPKLFRWFLPIWDKKNMNYNLAGCVHDALYGNKGFNVFTREECDDIFRGMLRECGISRIKAGFADKAVELAAKSHFGTDEHKVNKYVSLCF